MRHSIPTYALLVLAFVGCATTTAPPPAPAADFAAMEKRLMDAVTDKKYDDLELLLAPDFTNIRVFRNVRGEPVGSRAAWLANAKSRNWPRYDVSNVQVKQHGTSALVHAVITAEHEPGAINDTGGLMSFTVSDNWIWQDGRWQLTNRHASLKK